MMKLRLTIVGVVMVAAFLLGGCSMVPQTKTTAQDGVLDLADLDLASGIVTLDGEWAFYWNQLLEPSDFSGQQPVGSTIKVPGFWNSDPSGVRSGVGQATYRLLITGVEVNHLYSLTLPQVYTEYALWVNGQEVSGNGPVAGQPHTFLDTRMTDFYITQPQTEIILQVNNTVNTKGGISRSLTFGQTGAMHQAEWIRSAADLILAFFCIAAGIYFFLTFLFYIKRPELLCFAIFCVSAGVRGLLMNEALLMKFLPGLSYADGARIVSLTIPVMAIALLLYTYSLFKEDSPNLISETLIAINLAYAVMVLTAPLFVTASFFPAYIVVVLIAFLYGLAIAIRVIRRRRPDGWFFMAGMLFLAAGGLNDILNFMRLSNVGYYLTASVTLFIASHAIMLAKRLAVMYRVTQKMSVTLQQSIDKTYNTETAYLGAQIKPHFLYNALNTIAECCISQPAEAERLILSLSRYLRGTLDFENLGSLITLDKEIELVKAYVSIEEARFDNIKVLFDIDPGLLAVKLPPLTLQPLIENAIKHGVRDKAGGQVRLEVRKLGDAVRVCIIDNGSGIPDHKLPHLLEKPSGEGIGLANVNARLQRLYGKGLAIQSSSKAGTRVCFEIPDKEGA
jgi:two-component system, LytTR family, sensor kinase